ncbi:hypothetical protein ACOZ4N_11305 [Halorientalis pallida]|uniref:hypothetical protein n=1 Tax=Halorientalis pallida TaxID=2479928 RepID=UPI003C6F14E3
MNDDNRRKLVLVAVGLQGVIITLLHLFDAFTLDLFYILSFFMFWVAVELYSTPNLLTPYQLDLRWMIRGGFVVFVIVVSNRALGVIMGG